MKAPCCLVSQLFKVQFIFIIVVSSLILRAYSLLVGYAMWVIREILTVIGIRTLKLALFIISLLFVFYYWKWYWSTTLLNNILIITILIVFNLILFRPTHRTLLDLFHSRSLWWFLKILLQQFRTQVLFVIVLRQLAISDIRIFSVTFDLASMKKICLSKIIKSIKTTVLSMSVEYQLKQKIMGIWVLAMVGYLVISRNRLRFTVLKHLIRPDLCVKQRKLSSHSS